MAHQTSFLSATIILLAVFAASCGGDKGPAATELFINESMGYSIRYPSEWSVTGQGGFVQIFHPTGTIVDISAERSEGVSLEELLALKLDGFALAVPDSQEIARETIVTPPGYRVDLEFRSRGTRGLMTIVAHTNADLFISILAIRFESLRDLHDPMVDAMLTSLELYPPLGLPPDDHGTDSSDATAMQVGEHIDGDIEDASDSDYFSFEAVAGETYAIEVIVGSLDDSILSLLDVDGETVLDFKSDFGGNYTSRIKWVAPEPGTYFVLVENLDGQSLGTYTISISPPLNVQLLAKWGSGGTGDGQFNSAGGIAVDGSGDVYVTDTFNDRVQVFRADGEFLRKWGSPGSGDGQIDFPQGLAVDGLGNVYVVGAGNYRVQVFSANGELLRKWGSRGSGDGQFDFPTGIAVDGMGNVYVVETNNQRVQVFDADGTFLRKWGSGGTGDGQFQDPNGIALDGEGNIYVADTWNHRVQVFNANGEFLTKWGSEGRCDGQFSFPWGIAVDGSGKVYVGDTRNHRVQVFSSDGQFLGKWGSRGSGDGEFSSPTGIALDASGNVHVIDQGNNRVQVFRVELAQ